MITMTFKILKQDLNYPEKIIINQNISVLSLLKDKIINLLVQVKKNKKKISHLFQKKASNLQDLKNKEIKKKKVKFQIMNLYLLTVSKCFKIVKQ